MLITEISGLHYRLVDCVNLLLINFYSIVSLFNCFIMRIRKYAAGHSCLNAFPDYSVQSKINYTSPSLLLHMYQYTIADINGANNLSSPAVGNINYKVIMSACARRSSVGV